VRKQRLLAARSFSNISIIRDSPVIAGTADEGNFCFAVNNSRLLLYPEEGGSIFIPKSHRHKNINFAEMLNCDWFVFVGEL
jgi:hypothetical protein